MRFFGVKRVFVTITIVVSILTSLVSPMLVMPFLWFARRPTKGLPQATWLMRDS